jgi:hypothetical protein
VWQALRALEQRNEHGRESTIFVDSTSAITRVREDARGPGQRFGVAAIEVETRLAAAGNRVTIRWVPAHAGAEGNEVAGLFFFWYEGATMTGQAGRPGCAMVYIEKPTTAAMALRAACSGIENKRLHTRSDWTTAAAGFLPRFTLPPPQSCPQRAVPRLGGGLPS